ncbi:LpxI family protein [uncultured Lentibacter sp.]|uniref:LpxI family protein n=1 Tax=uncultured Lentibacter sp. TaxID=1659309 RepID=UPI00262EFF0A|nr:UDP-2,3-diacylglucosamine diphosphatase LpxI [uncultured Lentibacter sp.]
MLALIAGRGALPKAIADAQATPPLICAVEGFAPQELSVDLEFRLETLGSFLSALRARGVSEVCFCGAIARPRLRLSRLDLKTWPLVPLFLRALRLGDDGALRAVMALFEARGFEVRGAHELLAGLTMAAGVVTQARPQERHESLPALGRAVLQQMGQADLGQACVLRAKDVLAQEDATGTDAMLARVLAKGQGQGAVLYKAPKPDQDRRADLPTIGPATAAAAAEAGFDGIILEAGGVIVLDQRQVIERLDAAGMFLWLV